MAIPANYQEISIESLPELSARLKAEGHRFVQVLAVNTEAGIDVQYTFMKDGVLEVFTIKGVQKGMPIPSITDNFIAAFVFENEIHDLFGVEIRNIAIDFKGNFYAVAQREPMTIISPAQKAARDKAKKAAAAKAERARQAAAANASFVTGASVCEGEGHGRGFLRRRCRYRAEDGRRRPREDRPREGRACREGQEGRAGSRGRQTAGFRRAA